MDIATLYAKEAKKQGLMKDFDESDEINACSIRQKVNVDGQTKDYLDHVQERNAQPPNRDRTVRRRGHVPRRRDPRSAVGPSLRIPRDARHGQRRSEGEAVADTMPGKLPQRKICREAAHGYSSYGNQIGLATGLVDEIYHPGYKAKRMEIGAVIGAAPAENVVRMTPQPGDIDIAAGRRDGARRLRRRDRVLQGARRFSRSTPAARRCKRVTP